MENGELKQKLEFSSEVTLAKSAGTENKSEGLNKRRESGTGRSQQKPNEGVVSEDKKGGTKLSDVRSTMERVRKPKDGFSYSRARKLWGTRRSETVESVRHMIQ